MSEEETTNSISGDNQTDSRTPHDLEDNNFVCHLIEMAQPIHLWDAELSDSDLERDYPHRAYVMNVEYRLLRVVDRFHSLRVVDEMLSVADFPIRTPTGSISRYEWVRIAKDAILGRVTSVRDCLLLLVAEIYELSLEPRKVTLTAIDKMVNDRSIKEIVASIANVGAELRDERDRCLHRGEEAPLHGDMDIFYKIAAMFEPGSGPRLGLISEEGAQEVDLDLVEVHESVVAGISADFHRVAGELFALVERLFEAIDLEFDRRWKAKRDVAKDVRDWERSS